MVKKRGLTTNPLFEKTTGEFPTPEITKVVPKITKKLTKQSVSRSTSRPTSQPSSRQSEYKDMVVVGRPKAFYISNQVDEWLDKSVRYFKKRGIKKVDRSTVVNLILHDRNLWKSESLDKMRGKLIEMLTSQLVD